MADDKIKAYDRHGEKITIDRSEIGKLYALGGKLATKAEIESASLDAEYAARSTADKALGLATTALPAPAQAYLRATDKAPLPPTLEAYRRGALSGFTGGLGNLAEKEIADLQGYREGSATGGKDYVAKGDALAEAHGTAGTAGEIAGTIGSVVAGGAGVAGKAGRVAAPVMAGVSAVGEIAEQGAGRALAGLATKGAAGRAAVAATKVGARGAVEGGLLGATQYAADEALHDHDLAADKLFSAVGHGALYGGAGGAVLGAGGSLAASALSGAASVGKSALSRALERGEARAAEAAAPAAEEASTAMVRASDAGVSREAAQVMAEGGTLDAAVNGRLKKLSNEMAFDALGATKLQARSALEHVAGGADAVGEYVNRIAIAPKAQGTSALRDAFSVASSGRADEILEAIRADKAGRIATGLSESIKGTPAKINVTQLADVATGLHESMLRDPTKIAGADAFISRVRLEMGAIGRSGKIAADGTIDAADAFYLRSDLAKQAYELGRASGAAGDAYKTFLREWDKATISALDSAAEKAGKSGLGDQIRHWKREWQLASAAEEAAEGGAERMTRNNTFGIRESIGAAAGIATGHPLGAVATMLGGKVLRERGSATAAYALSQLAERGSLAKYVRQVDDQIAKASRGLLRPPEKGLVKSSEKMPPTRSMVKTALARVASFQSDPEAYVERATRQAESVAAHSPEIADGIVQRQIASMAFLASKVPQIPDPDPLDPHAAPAMTSGEESELARYAWYAERPERFFKEVARGKITFEGAETAQALMPRAFEELQDKTAEALASQLAKGEKLPFRQRHLLGVLLDMATTPSQRPDHARFLQGLSEPIQDPAPPPAPKRSLASGKPQLSALDRLEASGVGR